MISGELTMGLGYLARRNDELFNREDFILKTTGFGDNGLRV
jgi:hypothetical protein